MTDGLRLLIVSPTVSTYIGGTETVVRELSEHLKTRAHLSIVCGKTGQVESLVPGFAADKAIEWIQIPFLGRDTLANKLLSKLLMRSPFKIESYSFMRSLKAQRIDLTRFDRIVTFYETDAYLLAKHFPLLKERMRHCLPGVSIRRFFRQVAPANTVFLGYRGAPRALRKWGVSVSSLPLGVTPDCFPASAPHYPQDKRLVFVGRIDASKNVSWLCEFFVGSALGERGYRLEIIGDGPLLQELRHRHAHQNAVVFHGRQSFEAMVPLLQGAFLLLHPSSLESFGLSVLEAMAAGVPVITHDLDSIRAWAQDLPTYAAYLDRAAWLQAIAQFEQPGAWETKSRAGQAFARTLQWENVADRVFEFITR